MLCVGQPHITFYGGSYDMKNNTSRPIFLMNHSDRPCVNITKFFDKLEKYNGIRESIKTGDCILWHSNSLLGKIIQLFTKSEYNHASLVIRFSEFDMDRVYILEALENGIVLLPLSNRLESHNGEAFLLPLVAELDDIELRKIMARISLQKSGINYDYKSLLLNIFGRVNTDPNKFFCSEFWFYVLMKASELTMIGRKLLLKASVKTFDKAPTPADIPGLGLTKEPIRIL